MHVIWKYVTNLKVNKSQDTCICIALNWESTGQTGPFKQYSIKANEKTVILVWFWPEEENWTGNPLFFLQSASQLERSSETSHQGKKTPVKQHLTPEQ